VRLNGKCSDFSLMSGAALADQDIPGQRRAPTLEASKRN
jgi:hypothetical protein